MADNNERIGGEEASPIVPPPLSSQAAREKSSASAMSFLFNAESSYISYTYSDEEEDGKYSYASGNNLDAVVMTTPIPTTMTTRAVSTALAISMVSDGGYCF